MMKICLFGAGSSSIDKEYWEDGYRLGKCIAENNHTLVFGGGTNGLMGSVAMGCHENGGKVIGIMPEFMVGTFETLYEDCDEVIYTKNMDDRKIKFMELSDCFIVSPGGIGTMDEFFQVLTLKVLEVHDKEIILLDVDHFFDTLLNMIDDMTDKGAIKEKDKELFTITTGIDETMDYLNGISI